MNSALDTVGIFMLCNPLAVVAIVAGWCGAMALLVLLARHNERGKS